MPSFIAGAVVEPLDYDFTAFGGKKGVIAEPTDDLILAFNQVQIAEQIHQRKMNADLPDDATADDYLAAAQKAGDSAEVKEAPLREAQAHSDLCAGVPSVKDIMKLPLRIRRLFYAWLLKEITDPEAVAGGGSSEA